MFRDRTNLYLLYRRTVVRDSSSTHVRLDINDTKERFLSHSRHGKSSGFHDEVGPGFQDSYELQPMVPSFYDIAKELDELVSSVRLNISDLNGAYKRLIIVAKDEKRALENRIQDTSYNILKTFEQCYVLVKKFEYLSSNYSKLGLEYSVNDLRILDNFKKSYASRIQEQSLKFRNLQRNYIQFLRDDEDEADNLLPHQNLGRELAVAIASEGSTSDLNATIQQSPQLQQQQQQQQVQQRELLLMLEREREISNLAMGILEILTIFKEMESLVVDQGTLLDRIDYNLQNTVQDLKLSDKELVKAKNYQKRSTKCKLILLLSLVVLALFILVLVKPHHSTTVVQPPSETRPVKPPAKETAQPN